LARTVHLYAVDSCGHKHYAVYDTAACVMAGQTQSGGATSHLRNMKLYENIANCCIRGEILRQ